MIPVRSIFWPIPLVYGALVIVYKVRISRKSLQKDLLVEQACVEL
jgi:hypothetical protein